MEKNQIFGKDSETFIRREKIGRIAIPICALLNSKGGRIVIELQNKKGNHTTVDFEHKRDNILSKIRSELGKGVEQYIKISPLPNEANCDAILIEVQNLSQTPISLDRHYYCVKNGNYYQRIGCTTKPFVVLRKRREDAGISQLSRDTIGSNYFKIGNYPKGDGSYYKYMDIKGAILCFENSTIRFKEPCKWNDQYEKLFYNKNILGNTNSGNNPITLAYCLTSKKENEAAWKVYSTDENGKHSPCVQFKINRKKFREQLIKAVKNNYKLYEGVVSYRSETSIIDLHNEISKTGKGRRSLLSQRYLDNFDLESYLNLLLLKRDAFEHEHEVRMFIIPKNFLQEEKGKSGPKDLKINWSEVLEGVLVDAACSEDDKQKLKDSIDNYKFGEKPISNDLKIKLCPKPYDVYASAKTEYDSHPKRSHPFTPPE